MGNIKRFGLVFALLLFAAIVLVFTLENQLSVSLFFLGWEGPQLPVSIYIVLALLVGAAVGPFLVVAQSLRRRGRRPV